MQDKTNFLILVVNTKRFTFIATLDEQPFSKMIFGISAIILLGT